MIQLLLVAVLVSAVSFDASATGMQSLEFQDFFEEFHQDTKEVMNMHPAVEGPFSADFSFLNLRSTIPLNDMRTEDYEFSSNPIGIFSTIPGNNVVEPALDLQWNAWSNLHQMDAARLQTGQVSSRSMWSDSYWPMAKGGIAWRYAYGQASWDWSTNYKNYTQRPSHTFLKSQSQLNNLSPAEKYDLLMGDTNFSLTKEAWVQGKRSIQNWGMVEPWEGICHGWALASYMLKRPSRAVTVTDVTRRYRITFLPSDIKALASHLYSAFLEPVVGGRCSLQQPAKDPVTERIIDPSCQDLNPGAWHKAIVNQIGRSRRSFIMDQTYQAEVWNHPIQSYNLRYFNPQTGASAYNWKDAKVTPSQFTRDKFTRYRDHRTAHIVGVSMSVNYLIEVEPNRSSSHSSANDYVNIEHLRYDLEVDAQGNILGGEWYSNTHPDFIWGNPKNRRVTTEFDSRLNGQSLDQLIQQGRPYSSKAAKEYNIPLAKVVEKLVEMSQ